MTRHQTGTARYPRQDIAAFRSTPKFLGDVSAWVGSVLGLGLLVGVILGSLIQNRPLETAVLFCLFAVACLVSQVVRLRRALGQCEATVFPPELEPHRAPDTSDGTPYRVTGEHLAALERRIARLESREHFLGRVGVTGHVSRDDAAEIDHWLDSVGVGLRGDLHGIKLRLAVLEDQDAATSE
ncbi:MAG: hypothetical protein AAFY65_10830 [Pseudomonadota bacterium]